MLKKKVFCSILACLLLFCCLSVHTVALELDEPVVDSTVARATSQFSVEIPANGFRYVRTTFPMEYGEVVSIRAVYSPSSASVSFGLVDSDNTFHYITSTGGSFDHGFVITERGDYRLAMENNSSVEVSVTGFVTY